MCDSSSDQYALEVTRRRIAGVCAALGWQAAHPSSLELMGDLLRLYITRLGRNIRDNAESCNRSVPGIRDVAATFARSGIDPADLGEFAGDFRHSTGLDSSPVPSFPAPCPLLLNHLKPGSQEVLHRKWHVHDHLPAMYPEMEVAAEEGAEAGAIEGGGLGAAKEAGEVAAGEEGVRTEGQSELAKGKEAMPVREISSVIMTSHGFISPAREGKLPESRGPAVTQEDR